MSPTDPRPGVLAALRRWRMVPVVVLGAALALGGAITALAVHDQGFELDGNVAVDTTGNVDWVSFFNVDASGNATVKSTLPTDYLSATFIKDFTVGKTGALGGDSSTFATGSKDTLDITPGWQCSKSNNTLDKNEIVNAYAAALRNSSGDLILFFGFERASNNGDADVGFWFLKDSTVGCTAGKGNTAFTGHHQNGDILVVSEFTAGGDVSTIKVFEWQNGAAVLETTLSNPEPDCASVAAGDKACGIVNSSNLTPPWSTLDKDKDNVLNPTEFYEGGINLTQLGLVSSTTCFSKFMSVTRSSQEITATLFDYALGPLNTCGSITAKKYFDKNSDGSRQANGADGIAGNADDEVLLDGWTIFIDRNNDGILQPNGVDGIAGTADDELSQVTGAGGNPTGSVVFSNLPAGTYRLCEVLQTGWRNTDPTDGSRCKSVTIGAAGSQTVLFGNAHLLRLIVLTFDEVSGKLVDSTVDLDGNLATTGDTKQTLTSPPSGVTESTLFNLGGASYGNLSNGTYTPNVELPDVAPLFP